MPNFSLASFSLNKLLVSVEGLLPIAEQLGGPSIDKVAGIIKSGIDIAQNVLERADEAHVVKDSADVEEIKDIIKKLEAENDRLAAIIAAS